MSSIRNRRCECGAAITARAQRCQKCAPKYRKRVARRKYERTWPSGSFAARMRELYGW